MPGISARLCFDHDAGGRDAADLAEERRDLIVGDLGDERRRHHRNAAASAQLLDRGRRNSEWARDRGYVDGGAEQAGALLRRHHRELAIGAADEQPAVIERDHPFGGIGESLWIERSVGANGVTVMLNKPRRAANAWSLVFIATVASPLQDCRSWP